MRLSKLKLAGFKTFVDPTTVLLPGEMVGVVGPNGCGKSNIIDAVRWVLGETRASALRGESMQDVIFNGSSTRKPVSRASVELIFDNADGKAGGQWASYAEISVRRILERSGESAYYINNDRVRRLDVTNLFLGTGLGSRSAYAIIEQGMISRIIEARPEEIRGFLEEAAEGVSNYRERRRETEKRLSDARDNLARLDDIRLELGERIGHLEVQAETAERYKAFDTALRERQQLLWLIKRNEARDAQHRVMEELRNSTARIDADNARLQELESSLEAAREGHLAASESVHVAQSDFFAAGAEVSRLEAELQHLGETRQRLEARLVQLEAEFEHWRTRREGLGADRTRWEALAENASMRVEQAEARHMEIADREPELESAWRAAEVTVASVRRELTALEQQLRLEETNRAHAGRALDALGQRRAKLDDERSTIEGPDPARVAERQAWIEALRERCETLQESLLEAQAQQPTLRETLRAAMETDNTLSRRLTESRARLNTLKQLQARMSAQGKLDEWLAEHGHSDLPPLWRSLKVESGWEVAMEAVLRERLAARLTQADASLAQDLIEDPPPDALTLGFTNTLLDEPQYSLPGATPLCDLLITGDGALDALLADWLRGWFAVERLDDWLVRRDDLAPGVCLIDPRGQVLSRSMLAHFVPDNRTHGLMERQREIESLSESQRLIEDEALLAQQALRQADTAASEAQSKVDTLRQEVQVSQGERHAGEVEVLKLVQAANRAQEQSTRIESDFSELRRQEQGERERHDRAEREAQRATELAELQRARLEAAQDALRERDEALRELRTMEQSLARELQEAKFSERECASKLEDNVLNLQLSDEQIEKISTERQSRQAEREATDDSLCHESLQTALEVRSSREAVLATRRNALEQSVATLRELEELRLRTEHEAAPLRTRVADLRLEAQALELSAAQFDERLTEMGAVEATLAPLLIDAPSEHALQREVARLGREMTALGAVNLAAVEELRTSSERKSYLDAQNDDLLAAIGTLEDAIARMDKETREKLQATYNQVNAHFGKLFPQLFGGGRAELVLTGEEILDAGVQIVAQPPGKKNATIHLLSGGEKALTAIALVFAMFQIKPAPFCMLDEVDAPLDDANTGRYAEMVKQMSSHTQFVFISHNKITMEAAQQLVGVTMQEQGVSRVVEVDIEAALRMAEPAAA